MHYAASLAATDKAPVTQLSPLGTFGNGVRRPAVHRSSSTAMLSTKDGEVPIRHPPSRRGSSPKPPALAQQPYSWCPRKRHWEACGASAPQQEPAAATCPRPPRFARHRVQRHADDNRPGLRTLSPAFEGRTRSIPDKARTRLT